MFATSPTKYFIQIEDHKGGLRYINWFYKNFPDDYGFEDFLFECSIIYFSNGKIPQAEEKLLEFRDRDEEIIKHFISTGRYGESDEKSEPLSRFRKWLSEFVESEKMSALTGAYKK